MLFQELYVAIIIITLSIFKGPLKQSKLISTIVMRGNGWCTRDLHPEKVRGRGCVNVRDHRSARTHILDGAGTSVIMWSCLVPGWAPISPVTYSFDLNCALGLRLSRHAKPTEGSHCTRARLSPE